jgi:hypothetical protein
MSVLGRLGAATAMAAEHCTDALMARAVSGLVCSRGAAVVGHPCVAVRQPVRHRAWRGCEPLCHRCPRCTCLIWLCCNCSLICVWTPWPAHRTSTLPLLLWPKRCCDACADHRSLGRLWIFTLFPSSCGLRADCNVHCLGRHLITTAGDMTADGRLRLWQPEDTAHVPLAELQLAPCLKGDQVRVVISSANAPAGFTAELAQVSVGSQAAASGTPTDFSLAYRSRCSYADLCTGRSLKVARWCLQIMLHYACHAVFWNLLKQCCRDEGFAGCRSRRMSTS